MIVVINYRRAHRPKGNRRLRPTARTDRAEGDLPLIPRVAEFWERVKRGPGHRGDFRPDRGGAGGQDPLPPDSFPKGRTGR